MAQNERPREKLLQKGAASLTDAELLAIFIGSGIKGQTALDLARTLLLQAGNLRNVLHYSLKEFCLTPGIGAVSYLRFQAALEIAQRCFKEKLHRQTLLDTPAATRSFLQAKLQDLPHEVFAAFMLDNKNRVIEFEILFQGTLDQSTIYPREIIKKILSYNAAAIIFVHNHPSGIVTPSSADIQLTHTLKKALDYINVRVLDHFIVGDNEMIALSELGLL